jgi:hypothetical protein
MDFSASASYTPCPEDNCVTLTLNMGSISQIMQWKISKLNKIEVVSVLN